MVSSSDSGSHSFMISPYSILSLSSQSLHESEYSVTDPTSNVFLPWQTCDLMRITWYGFKEFCEYFVQRHPGYAVYPLQLNGSAVETIFSRLKFNTGGHLCSKLCNSKSQLDHSLWCAWSTIHQHLQGCPSLCKGAQTN